MEEKEYRIKFSEKQTLALKYLSDPSVKELLIGGAKGGGKTYFECYSAYIMAKQIIKLANLKPSKYPPVVGFFGRKVGVHFVDNTLEKWKRCIPPEGYTIGEQKKEIVIENTVKMDYGGFDDTETVKKFNSAEYIFAIIDQTEENSRDGIANLRGTLNRDVILNGVKFPSKFVASANPSECWIEDDFDVNEQGISPPFRKFVKMLPTDNPFINSEEYIAGLKEAWKHRPEMVQAYVFGSWKHLKGANFLIHRDWIDIALKTKLVEPQGRRVVISNDPAWLGEQGDEIVIYVFQNYQVIDSYFSYNQDTNVIASEMMKFANKYDAGLVTTEAMGIGVGVFDNCVRLSRNLEILGINTSESCEDPTDSERFLNKRAEIWWKVAEMIGENKIPIPNDPELHRQLCAVKYEVKNGRIKITDKKEVKKILGRSPDRADAFTQGIWSHQFCPVSGFPQEDSQFVFQGRRRGY